MFKYGSAVWYAHSMAMKFHVIATAVSTCIPAEGESSMLVECTSKLT